MELTYEMTIKVAFEVKDAKEMKGFLDEMHKLHEGGYFPKGLEIKTEVHSNWEPSKTKMKGTN